METRKCDFCNNIIRYEMEYCPRCGITAKHIFTPETFSPEEDTEISVGIIDKKNPIPIALSETISSKNNTNSTTQTVDFSSLASKKENLIKKKISEVERQRAERLFSLSGTVINKCKVDYPYLEIPSWITEIGNEAFAGCNRLVYLILPESIITLGDRAFADCPSLQYVQMPVSLRKAGKEIFANDNMLVSCPWDKMPEGFHRKWKKGIKKKQILFFNTKKPEKNCNITEKQQAILSAAYSKVFEEFSQEAILNEKKTELIKYTGNSSDIFIPNGIEVIHENAFESSDKLFSLYISATVKTIASGAFARCSNLERIFVAPNNCKYFADGNCIIEKKSGTLIAGAKYISLPSDGSIISIGKYAFAGSSIEDMLLPSSVKKIEPYAFADSSLRFLSMYEKSIEEIGEGAFYYCRQLRNFIMPTSVKVVGEKVFKRCVRLKIISLSANLKKAESNIFENCISLSEIIVQEGHPRWKTVRGSVVESFTKTLVIGPNKTDIPDDGSIQIIAPKAYIGRDGLTEAIIPHSIVAIGENAFKNCTQMVKLEIEKGVVRIEKSAFENCRSLKEVVFPKTISEIESRAFADCVSLTGYELANGVSYAQDAFAGCTGVTSVVLPSNIENNPKNELQQFPQLKKISMQKGVGKYKIINNCVIEVAQKKLVYALPDSQIPSDGSVLSIGEYAFEGTTITTVEIPSPVESIELRAFADCKQLTSVSIAKSVKTIDSFCFSNCIALSKITFPPLKQIGYCAFSGCRSINNISFPKTITEIGECAFAGCTKLQSVELPEELITLGKGSFSGCTSLTSVVFGKKIKEIQPGAFSGCDNLKFLAVDPLHTSWRGHVDHIVDVKTDTLILGTGDCEVTQVSAIGKGAFYGQKISNLILPSTVTYIMEEAYKDCTFGNIAIPSSVQFIDYAAFYGIKGVKELVIPSYVSNLGKYAFANTSIERIILSSGIRTIGEGCFFNNKYMTDIYIPDTVQEIGSGAFSNCGRLNSIFIPRSVTKMGEKVFTNCPMLTIMMEAAYEPSGFDREWVDTKTSSQNLPPAFRSMVWKYQQSLENDTSYYGSSFNFVKRIIWGVKRKNN